MIRLNGTRQFAARICIESRIAKKGLIRTAGKVRQANLLQVALDLISERSVLGKVIF